MNEYLDNAITEFFNDPVVKKDIKTDAKHYYETGEQKENVNQIIADYSNYILRDYYGCKHYPIQVTLYCESMYYIRITNSYPLEPRKKSYSYQYHCELFDLTGEIEDFIEFSTDFIKNAVSDTVKDYLNVTIIEEEIP